MKTLKDFFKKNKENLVEARKDIANHIREQKQNEKKGKFFVPVGKIDNFYNNICDCVKNNKKVYIYGDYDVDGMLSVVMLLEALKSIALDVYRKKETTKDNVVSFLNNLAYTIPKRTDGYGLSEEYAMSIYKSDFDYIITCDNGTHTAMRNIIDNPNYLNKYFSFDHHSNGNFEEYPNILNPNKDGETEISTGILLYRFFEKLANRHDVKMSEFADLATFTAVSDIASLDSNRDIVKKGLSIINNAEAKFNAITEKIEETGEKAIKKIDNQELNDAEKLIKKINKMENEQKLLEEDVKNRRPIYGYLFNSKVITEKDLAFNAIPKLNAINRMGADARFLIDAFLIKQYRLNEQTEKELDECVFYINHLNSRRKEITQTATKEALEAIYDNKISNNAFIFLYMEDMNIGLNGLIAQRVFDKTGADVIVASKIKEGNSAGKISFSGRGNNVFNNLEILANQMQEYKTVFSFGGHLKALGGEIRNLEKFEELVKTCNDSKLFIQPSAVEKLDMLKEQNFIITHPLSLFEYVDLAKHYTKKTEGIPYSKNVYAKVIVTPDMIENLEDTKAKMAKKEYVSLKLGFYNPISDESVSLRYITNSDDAKEMITQSEEAIKNKKIPIFLFETPSGCYDNHLGTFSGNIVFVENTNVQNYIKEEEKISNKIENKSSGIKIWTKK